MNTNPNYPYQPVMQPIQHDSGAAIASLIFGILAYFGLFGVGALVAVICGHIGMSQVKAGNGMVRGKGLATAGLVLGYIQIGVLVLVILGFIFLAPALGDVYSDIYTSMY